MNLIDLRLVVTQILGFLVLLWALNKWALGPLVGVLEARRAKIAAEFEAAERAKAEAQEEKNRYQQELRGIEARARQRLTEAVAEGQKVAAEIRQQAQAEAARRLERAQDDIARENEKAKERVKEQVIDLAMRSAEKILRQKLDDPAQRRLAGEFIDEVEALR
ncbi:MAG TPA: F0F1 ATP synthase subunit B [Candidatus Eisenbacteria bacterium]|jgi:F-type H+-transporting ATPase subunit b